MSPEVTPSKEGCIRHETEPTQDASEGPIALSEEMPNRSSLTSLQRPTAEDPAGLTSETSEARGKRQACSNVPDVRVSAPGAHNTSLKWAALSAAQVALPFQEVDRTIPRSRASPAASGSRRIRVCPSVASDLSLRMRGVLAQRGSCIATRAWRGRQARVAAHEFSCDPWHRWALNLLSR